MRSWRHKGLRRLYVEGDETGVKAAHVRRLRLILVRLNASRTARDMDLPGLRLHKLRGALADSWAVDVSANYRVVFRFNGKDVVAVDDVDYH